MNDEIKLILTKLKIVSQTEESGAYICDRGHSKLLLDYITNLQEELEEEKRIEEEDLKAIMNLEEENTAIKERCEYLQRSCERKEEQMLDYRQEYMEQEDYKSRNEKAILMLKELNNKIKEILKIDIDVREISDIENILQGDDNEKEEHDKIIKFVNSEDYMLLNSYISKPYEETIIEQDKEIEILKRKNAIMLAYLQLIIDIGYDYDGYQHTSMLKCLIDEIIGYASMGIKFDDKTIISEGSKGEEYNILGEELKNNK